MGYNFVLFLNVIEKNLFMNKQNTDNNIFRKRFNVIYFFSFSPFIIAIKINKSMSRACLYFITVIVDGDK